MEKIRRNILCIDLKSFYASAECVLHGVDPFTTKLAVAGSVNREGSIILAASIGLKKMGVKNRCRLYEVPKGKDVMIVQARMKKYLEISNVINSVYLNFVSPDDMHIYSIDETFLDVTNSMHLFAKSDVEMAELIINSVYEKTGIPSACGIGDNMLLAKYALDLEAKNTKTQVAKWKYEDIPTKLWPIRPLSKVWGIGSKMEKKLNRMGFYEIGDIAKCNKNKIIDKFGVLGEELYAHVHGYDLQIRGYNSSVRNRSYGMGQTLFKDYFENTKVLLLEMAEKQGKRLRDDKYNCTVVHLSVSYSLSVGGGGFSRQMKVDATNHTKKIHETLVSLFDKHYEKSYPIRRLRISLSGIVKCESVQMSLFEDIKKVSDLDRAVDYIKDKFGKTSVLRGVSYTKDGTAKYRSSLIGGHNAELGSEFI